MSEWQPIETAPAFERVLLYGNPLCFGEDTQIITGIKSEHPSGDIWVSRIGQVKPTHWMPLPEPPKS